VVSVSNPQDAYTVIQQAILSDDPVLYFEPKRRYHDKGEVDESLDLNAALSLEKARVVTEGRDVTLVAYGPLVKTARDAATAAADEGVSVEVIDLRSLAPVDFATLEASVRKTGRLVITHEAGQSGGVGAELAASNTERCFHHLEAAPVRVTASTSRTRIPSWKCITCPAWTGSWTGSTVPSAAPTPSVGWKDERHHDQGFQAAGPRRRADRI